LVERRGDPVDRRVKRIHLTKAGSKLVRDIRASVTDVEKDIVDGVEVADLQATIRALRTMKSNLLNLLGAGKDTHLDEVGAEAAEIV
jgi:MarR family transcriptional regulator for hemolysin